MIFAFCLLGTFVVFLAIVIAVLYFQVIRPMQRQLAERITAHPSEEVEAVSRRADEIALASKTNHLDIRGDIVRLARRVDELEIVANDRSTKVVS